MTPRPEPIHRDDQPEAGPSQTYYDHKRVPGDPVSDLADALKARGWACVVAHTGGGCMSVSVELDETRSALIGADPPGFGNVNDATSGGMDVETIEGDDHYLGSYNITCKAGDFINTASAALRSARDKTLPLS